MVLCPERDFFLCEKQTFHASVSVGKGGSAHQAMVGNLDAFSRRLKLKPHYLATHSVRKPAMGCPDLALVRHDEPVEEQGIPFIPGILGEAGQEISVFLT